MNTASLQDDGTQDAAGGKWSFAPDCDPANMSKRHLLDITTALQTASRSKSTLPTMISVKSHVGEVKYEYHAKSVRDTSHASVKMSVA
jgi:hypothetical protein